MASKAELEQKVAELEAALAAAPDAAQKLPILEQEVGTLKAERDQLSASLDAATQQVVDLQGKQNDAVDCTVEDHVVLDGIRYKNIHRNTVKELSIDLLKRYVREDLTAVVIDKAGG